MVLVADGSMDRPAVEAVDASSDDGGDAGGCGGGGDAAADVGCSSNDDGDVVEGRGSWCVDGDEAEAEAPVDAGRCGGDPAKSKSRVEVEPVPKIEVETAETRPSPF